MIRAAAYARFSSDNQRDESIDAQLRAIHKFAQYIFNSVLNGKSYADISEELNQRGWHTRRGMEFGKNSLYEILRNEKYAGVYTFRRSTPANPNGKRNNHGNRSDMIRVEGVFLR